MDVPLPTMLAIDTSCGQCSVALSVGGDVSVLLVDDQPSKQAELLFVLIEEALMQQNMTYHDIDKLVVIVGPGSFTGVRIAIAAIQGISLVTNLPVIPVSSCHAIAWQYHKQTNEPGPYAVINDAKRGQVSVQLMDDRLLPSSQVELYDVSHFEEKRLSLKGYRFIGSGVVCVANDCDDASVNICADAAGAIYAALSLIQTNNIAVDNQLLTPLYTRPPDAIKK